MAESLFSTPGVNPNAAISIAAAHTAIIEETFAIIPFNAKKVPALRPPVFKESKSTTSASIEAGRNWSPPKHAPLSKKRI